jgi:hypothetical protein
MKVVLVHGFNVRDGGKRTVDQLAPFIEAAGHEVDVDEGDYGFFNIWMIRFRKSKTRRRVIYRLAKAFETADVLIFHSNGSNFGTQALDLMGPEFNNTKLVIHISAALDQDAEIPNAVHHQLVLYTPHDKAVRASSWLWFHPWGRMGAKGYSGDDNRNMNVMDSSVQGHSDWFKTGFVRSTWNQCNAFIRSHEE